MNSKSLLQFVTPEFFPITSKKAVPAGYCKNLKFVKVSTPYESEVTVAAVVFTLLITECFIL